VRKKVAFVLFLLCATGLFSKSSDLTDNFYKKDLWGFVGKKFYDNPLQTYNKTWKKAFRVFSGAAGMCAGGLAGKKLLSKNDLLAFVGMFGGAFGGLVCFYGILNSQMKRYADYEALKDFVHRWERYKEFTPEDLHEVFDEMYALYSIEGWDSIKSDTQEIVKEVRKSLANNDLRYAELYKTQQDFFDAKYFLVAVDIDVAALIKVFWDIFKDNRQG
jgi:hypothetical protein